jgi:DnaJ like chaperone protein
MPRCSVKIEPMSIWTRIADALSALTSGEGLGSIFDAIRTRPERSIGFTIAVIALGAKMAKADGLVTRDEVTAFREVFQIAKADEENAARVFNLARADVAGFEDYAAKIKAMFSKDRKALGDLMEGLFHIAVADGDFHPNEDVFLARVAELFDLEPRSYTRLRARFVVDAIPDPYDVLGVLPDAPLATIKATWRRLVKESHPDQLVGRGLPPEAVQMAAKRLVDLNLAWETISKQRVVDADRHL